MSNTANVAIALCVSIAISAHGQDTLRTQRRNPVGCYRATPFLTYSANGEPDGRDTSWAFVRLSADGSALRPLVGRVRDSRSNWTSHKDTLFILLFDGLVGWRLTLLPRGNGWRGNGRYLSDAIVTDMPPIVHEFVLERGRCPMAIPETPR